MYRNYLNNWEENPLPEINMDFIINGRIYRISPSTLNGSGPFTVDGVKVPYNSAFGLIGYVVPHYGYEHLGILTRYLISMHIHGFCENYNKMKETNQDKGYSIHIDGRPKAYGNIARFISTTHPRNTNKLPNCVFVECEESKVVVTAIN